MLLTQNFLTALRGLLANKLRSSLTILGIVIGVAAVVALMAIGNGATSSITSRIASNGSNLLNIQAGRSQRPAPGAQFAPTYLTYKDYQALSKTLTEVAGIAPAYQSNGTVTHGTISASVTVIGVTEDYLNVHTYELAAGRNLSANDREKKNQVAVIGATAAETLFPNETILGHALKINNVTFNVVGVLKSKGSSGFDNQDDLLLIPLETGYIKLFGANAIRNGERMVSAIAISASSADTVDLVSSQINFIMRRTHRLAPDQDADFRIMNQAQLLSTLTSVTTTLTTFLGAIAALSLLVGGIGIMNITLVSVSERTREIGLRKAVGARKDHILFQFLVETMTLSVTGGVIGILIGVGIAFVVTRLGLITAQVTLSSILLSFFFSMAIGLFFGIYPAYRAANLEPMEALRSE
ncbi:MAG TPA: ABC transporter permease [Anaerolineales bacterium]|jgi:putative ABC transport system permease protein